MWFEAVWVICTFLIAGVIGLGPALALVRNEADGLATALGIAPVFGLAIVGYCSFPLVRFVAPVQVWALPLTVILALASVSLLVWWVRTVKPRARPFTRRSGMTTGLILAGSIFMLCAPMVINGITYAVFRRNSSDAFYYTSVSEMLRVANWQTILDGVALEPNNLNNIARLTHQVPSSLFAARFMLMFGVPNNQATRAWMAALGNVPVERIHFAYEVLALCLTVPIAFVVTRQLRIRGILRGLTVLVLALGFWARFMLESDSANQVLTIPLVLFIFFAWVRLEENVSGIVSRHHALLAFALVVTATFYVQVLSIVVIAFVLYYGAMLFGGAQGRQRVRNILVTAALAFLFSVVTWQLDFILRDAWFQTFDANDPIHNQALYAMQFLLQDGIAGLWGMPRSLVVDLLGWVNEPAVLLRRATDAMGISVTIALVWSLGNILVKRAVRAHLILVALVTAGAGLAFYFGLRGIYYSGSKAVTYIYPYLTFAVVIAVQYIAPRFPLWRQRAATAAIGAWLVVQLALGFWLPYTGVLWAGNQSGNLPREDYELTLLTHALDQAQPKYLVVNVPAPDNWEHAFFMQHAFGHYPVYFQSGLLYDNFDTKQNIWFERLARVPDYVVIAKNADYVGAQGLGKRIAETGNLNLYQITTADLKPFVEADAQIRATNARKEPNPLTAVTP